MQPVPAVSLILNATQPLDRARGFGPRPYVDALQSSFASRYYVCAKADRLDWTEDCFGTCVTMEPYPGARKLRVYGIAKTRHPVPQLDHFNDP